MPLLLGRVCLGARCLVTPPHPWSSTTSAILFIAFLLPAVFYFIGLRVTAVFSLNHYTDYLAGSLISFFLFFTPILCRPHRAKFRCERFKTPDSCETALAN